MFSLYKSGFRVCNSRDLNEFVRRILWIGENYLRFLVSRNRIYLPFELEPKDAAVDLLGELFVSEDNVLVKFKNFFSPSPDPFPKGRGNYAFLNEDDFENRLRGFIYTVIQNNLPGLYRDSDPVTYNIYRNIKEAVKLLNYHISIHFSDKYIHPEPEIDFTAPVPDREDMLLIIYSNGMAKNILNVKSLLQSLFEILKSSENFAPALRLSDLAAVVKSTITSEFAIKNASPESDDIASELNTKLMLDDVKFAFAEKLNKYTGKAKLSQNFSESMYNVIDEMTNDLLAGNERKSVMELLKRHFNSEDKNMFYKVQYCVELFEGEIAKYAQRELSLAEPQRTQRNK
jgi:hypothetical protein